MPSDISIVLHDSKIVEFSYMNPISHPIYLILNSSEHITFQPREIFLNGSNITDVTITGVAATSETFLEITECTLIGSENPCPFNKSDAYVRVVIVHSKIVYGLVIITGWIYFFAWSISFWPQIMLNFQRKSVQGLNFDYLVLNVIGYFCYMIYNLLMYSNDSIQSLYENAHPRSLIPVLLNDVLFAVHGLFASTLMGLQCFCYERGKQRVSYICISLSTILVLFSFASFAFSFFEVFSWLQFIKNLSYVKMVVTLSKYVPQVILNWRNKSTVGWSIINVLLDFTGGFMDIMQMIFQAINTDDWSGFYGNPVKFGLGLVTIVFDAIFIVQHYGLYRHPESEEKERIKILENNNHELKDRI
uniref:Cystinosin n=1 Tax=Acrobeloides nanus TaxID=290746 RepID=A0A914DT48_9BILA